MYLHSTLTIEYIFSQKINLIGNMFLHDDSYSIIIYCNNVLKKKKNLSHNNITINMQMTPEKVKMQIKMYTIELCVT